MIWMRIRNPVFKNTSLKVSSTDPGHQSRKKKGYALPVNRDGPGAAVPFGEGGGGGEGEGGLGNQLPVVPQVEEEGVGGEEAALLPRPLPLVVLVLRHQLRMRNTLRNNVAQCASRLFFLLAECDFIHERH